MFTHVIMTRFNLATPGREYALRTQPGWLAQRFELFERYCLPSVAAQSSLDFEWVIYFDEATPPEFRARIEELRRVHPFIPYFTGLFPAEGWPRSIREVCRLDQPCLLSTRLDNDDALARDFVGRLHAVVDAEDADRGIYNFRRGLIRRGGRVYALNHETNPFFSLLEPVGPDLRTASSIQHMKIHAHGPVHQIDGPPTWMQIVHETNVSNKVRGRLADSGLARDRFDGAASVGLEAASAPARILDAVAVAPLRGARDTLLSLRSRR